MIGVGEWCVVKIAGNDHRIRALPYVSSNSSCLPGPESEGKYHFFTD